jgi:hypothetical protein
VASKLAGLLILACLAGAGSQAAAQADFADEAAREIDKAVRFFPPDFALADIARRLDARFGE